jgi:hypothetical protein
MHVVNIDLGVAPRHQLSCRRQCFHGADGIIGVGLKVADCDEKGLWQEGGVQRRGQMEGRATCATNDHHPVGSSAVLADNPL